MDPFIASINSKGGFINSKGCLINFHIQNPKSQSIIAFNILTKTIMKTNLCYILMVLGILSVSCEGERGEQGITGEPGDNCWTILGDVNGDGETNSLDCVGVDGVDGNNCWDTNNDGIADPDEDVNKDGNHDVLDCQGSDGQNSNFTAQKLEIDVSQVDTDLTQVNIAHPEITSELLQNSTLIFFLEDIEDNTFLAIPGRSDAQNRQYDVVLAPGEVILGVSDYDGFNDYGWIEDSWDTLHITIITIDPDAINGKSTQQDVLASLKLAGVDVTNYQEVMAHFGL
ncbi:MAG: hypothetical protein AAF969_05080 [Bacteroidota bacterium]